MLAGTSTNANLELIGEALEFRTQAITTNAGKNAQQSQMDLLM